MNTQIPTLSAFFRDFFRFFALFPFRKPPQKTNNGRIFSIRPRLVFFVFIGFLFSSVVSVFYFRRSRRSRRFYRSIILLLAARRADFIEQPFELAAAMLAKPVLSQISPRIIIAVFHRFCKPFHRFLFILFHAFAEMVSVPHAILRLCIPLFRRFLIPLKRLEKVCRHAQALRIAVSYPVLRRTMPFFRRLQKQRERPCVIAPIIQHLPL